MRLSIRRSVECAQQDLQDELEWAELASETSPGRARSALENRLGLLGLLEQARLHPFAAVDGGMISLFEAAVLVTSELMTNAVRATPGQLIYYRAVTRRSRTGHGHLWSAFRTPARSGLVLAGPCATSPTWTL
ncbi:hypothetical protein [Actinomadura flavalba]|uniref:hypothetical protein n=1 Tax=Actinomadura flavalba TaxID=1120938 RepID=UPI00035DCF6A|nr:hypothetical protein [Actinomadura flavalba]